MSYAKINGSFVFISKCCKFWETHCIKYYHIISFSPSINEPVIITHNLTNSCLLFDYIGFKFQYYI